MPHPGDAVLPLQIGGMKHRKKIGLRQRTQSGGIGNDAATESCGTAQIPLTRDGSIRRGSPRRRSSPPVRKNSRQPRADDNANRKGKKNAAQHDSVRKITPPPKPAINHWRFRFKHSADFHPYARAPKPAPFFRYSAARAEFPANGNSEPWPLLSFFAPTFALVWEA